MCRRYFYPYFYPVVKRNKKIFYFISFEVIKIKNVLKLRILLYFSSNKRSIPLVNPPGHRPTRIYAHQKRMVVKCGHSSFGSQILNFFCNLVNEYVAKLFFLSYLNKYHLFVLTTKQTKYRKRSKLSSPCVE